jgi:hypothetical protein
MPGKIMSLPGINPGPFARNASTVDGVHVMPERLIASECGWLGDEPARDPNIPFSPGPILLLVPVTSWHDQHGVAACCPRAKRSSDAGSSPARRSE